MQKKNAILVVEDEYINRRMLVNILQSQYDVLEAENGKEALEVLRKNAQNIAVVVLDLIMPEMNGYEFLEKYGNIQEYRNIPVIVVTADSNDENEKKCLTLGVWDFVMKPYNPQIISFRIANAIERGRIQEAERDSLTGVFSKEKFYQVTRKMLSEHTDEKFVFVRLDIDRFKLINTFYGLKEGDRLLKYIANEIKEICTTGEESTFGRIGGDIFCFCMPYQKEHIQKVVEHLINYLNEFEASYYIEPSFGIYIVEDNELDIPIMYDRATLAAKGCKGKYMEYMAYYDTSMNDSLLKEQIIVNEMDNALKNGEFVPYLQPKYSMKTNQPFGAEALVRWMHPTKGMISPGIFIPVFERNGFIGKLDYYMWEQICILLRKWIDEGQNPAPISVNVSRVNIYDPQLVDKIEQLVDKYHVPARLLNLEVTESAFIENQDVMKETIRRFREKGFVILMDDFGSGYSSLNTLKDIEMDILKIDMKFLPDRVSDGRGEKILTSIVRMAKWLDLPVVVEGVETAEQDAFLRSISVDYIQGYYYARPMPVKDYEELINDINHAKKEQTSGTEVFDLFNDLWKSDSQVNELFEKLSQPVAIFEFNQDQIELLRMNPEFQECMDIDIGRSGKTVFYNVDESEKEILLSTFKNTAETMETSECDYMRFDRKGQVGWMHIKVQFLAKTQNAYILLGMFTNITESKKLEKELEKFESALNTRIEDHPYLLVLDDLEINRVIIRELFMDKYEILEAENGAVGLELLQKYGNEIEIIILDLLMPVLDGKGFLKEKNKNGKFSSIPVVVVSSEDSKSMQLSMLEMGVNDYITKPFVSEIVKRRIQNVLEYRTRFNTILEEYKALESSKG